MLPPALVHVGQPCLMLECAGSEPVSWSSSEHIAQWCCTKDPHTLEAVPWPAVMRDVSDNDPVQLRNADASVHGREPHNQSCHGFYYEISSVLCQGCPCYRPRSGSRPRSCSRFRLRDLPLSASRYPERPRSLSLSLLPPPSLRQSPESLSAPAVGVYCKHSVESRSRSIGHVRSSSCTCTMASISTMPVATV
jgi:hypothetical protein